MKKSPTFSSAIALLPPFFIDRAAHLTVYDAPASGVTATSTKRYFVDWRLEVWETSGEEERKQAEKEGRRPEAKLLFAHDYDAKGQNVLMKFAEAALGDLLAWFPYAEEFRKKHGCRLFVEIEEIYSSILRAGYLEIHFLSPGEKRPENLYATYYVGLFAPWDDRDLQPVDWRVAGLQAHGAYLLGLPVQEARPRLLPSAKAKALRPKEPYVCIATQATARAKYWNRRTLSRKPSGGCGRMPGQVEPPRLYFPSIYDILYAF